MDIPGEIRGFPQPQNALVMWRYIGDTHILNLEAIPAQGSMVENYIY